MGLRGNATFFVAYGRPLNLHVPYVGENFLYRLSTKGFLSNENLVDYNSKTPPVNGLVVCGDSIQNLWSNIIGCANDRFITALFAISPDEGLSLVGIATVP